ncbi:helix-turn-helix domain-containing protein, partial [Streptomyces sp. S6]
MDVTLRQLAAYAAVARAASFTAAAVETHVSQSSLSRAVADLERALDLRLLERDTRNVRLTPAGSERLEDRREFARGDADARVGDGERDHVQRGPGHPEFDP